MGLERRGWLGEMVQEKKSQDFLVAWEGWTRREGGKGAVWWLEFLAWVSRGGRKWVVRSSCGW